MDKDIKSIYDAMLTTKLPKAMKRFFAHYVIELLEELYSDTTITIDANMVIQKDTLDVQEKLKAEAFAKRVLVHEKIKNMLCKVLDTFKQRRDYVVELFLKQYNFSFNKQPSDETTYFHDRAGMYFDAELNRCKACIRAGEYRVFWDTLGI